jgi:DNA-binding helix-turn-helix protein
MNGFENWIKDICKRKKMKLKDVSTKMDVEPASLTRTLKGGNPRLDTLVKLADALEVEITALIPREIKQ